MRNLVRVSRSPFPSPVLTLRLFSSTLRLFSSTVCPCSRALPRACAHGFAGLKRWIELGNSGVFRPEMLRPMGLPENVTVIAWGISLERPTTFATSAGTRSTCKWCKTTRCADWTRTSTLQKHV